MTSTNCDIAVISFIKKDLSKLHNIGDLLCTPDNYFEVVSDSAITVVGGGVWDIEKMSTESTACNIIVWAAGRSIRYPNIPRPLQKMKFLSSGFRDLLDIETPSLFLPCVSCLNTKIMQEPMGDKTLVFTNANSRVSSPIDATNSDRLYLTNDCSEDEFMSAWMKCDKVITNSYHGIYWSMLSGRSVAPYGYSSKFTNVMAMFDLEIPVENIYTVGSRHIVSRLVNDLKQRFFKPNEPKLEQFQQLNLSFAHSLSKVGIECHQKSQ
jgi:hypothetical protein